MEYKLLSSIFYSNNSQYDDIYNQRFNSESTYKFNFYIDGNQAFVVINSELLQKNNKIMTLDKTLSRLMQKLPGIALNQYIKTCLIDEIKMTNEIEGVYSTRKEINDIIENIKKDSKRDRLYGLVKKYELLLNEKIELNTCEDIRNLYNDLVLKEVVDDDALNKPDGKIFRANPVHVQSATGKNIHDGLYPEDSIIDSMTNALNILNNEDYDLLIRIAVFHYMFGYIHPFYDGNGRTSRFISSYLLSRQLQVLVSYRLSYTIKENINSYYKSFKIANDPLNKGDLTSFVLRFYDILIKSLDELCSSLISKGQKLDYLEDIVVKICNEDIKLREVLSILVQNTLFGEQGLAVIEIQKILESTIDIGESKIRKLLSLLEDKKLLLIQKDGRRYLYNVDINKLILDK